MNNFLLYIWNKLHKSLFIMIKSYISIILFLLLTSSINAQEATRSHKDSLNTIVAKYYELNFNIFQVNSTVEDIDKVFDLFTEDFTYTHPKYGGVYTREVLYNGYIRNQKNGGYDGNVLEIKILNKIVGLNAVVVEKRFVRKEEERKNKEESDMTLFEFSNGKISKIFEYW